jgi:hypothetical protein
MLAIPTAGSDQPASSVAPNGLPGTRSAASAGMETAISSSPPKAASTLPLAQASASSE